MPVKNYIPYTELIEHCYVNEGDSLLIASDMTRLAMVTSRHERTFNINLFIDSICKKLGPDGSLIIPAYNHELRNGDSFDPKTTRPVTGALALSAFERDDVIRTKHPLHSFLVWGKLATFFKKLENKSSFGPDSPFAFFEKHGVKMLMLSTSISKAFTYAHYIEEKEKVRYRKYRELNIQYAAADNNTANKVFSIYAKKRGWDLDFKPLEKKFIDAGILRRFSLNGLKMQWIEISKTIPLLEEDIRENKAHSLACFSLKLYLKSLIKDYLYKLKLFISTADKIRHAGNIF